MTFKPAYIIIEKPAQDKGCFIKKTFAGFLLLAFCDGFIYNESVRREPADNAAQRFPEPFRRSPGRKNPQVKGIFKMTLPELMIFDMDGILFNSEQLFMDTEAIVFQDYGYVMTKENYIRTLGACGDELKRILYDTYGPDYPADEISAKTRKLVAEHVEKYGPEIKPGIIVLLEWLKSKNIPCCVATSTNTAIAKRNLELACIDGYFSFVIGGDQISRSTPDPEIFLACCEKKNIRASRALVLEDSENGILAAYRGGIPVICIPDMKYPDPEFAEKCEAVLTSAEEVPNSFAAETESA